MKKLQAGLVGLAFAGVLLPAAAEVGEIPVNPALRDPFYFAIGAFFPKTTTEAQLDSTRLGVGANVTFESTLGMGSRQAVPSATGRMRLGEHWRIEAEWFQLNRDGVRTIDRQIQWGDTVFPVNTQLSSTFDFYDLRLSAGFILQARRQVDRRGPPRARRDLPAVPARRLRSRLPHSLHQHASHRRFEDAEVQSELRGAARLHERQLLEASPRVVGFGRPALDSFACQPLMRHN